MGNFPGFSPFGLFLTGIQTAQLAVEAQTVITLRLLGMAGLWPVSRTEMQRMWTEKPSAFVQSGGAATMAAMTGKRPDQIMDAAIKPLRAKTRANSRRLSRRKRI